MLCCDFNDSHDEIHSGNEEETITNRFSSRRWIAAAFILSLRCWLFSTATVRAENSDLSEAGDVLQIALPDR